ncbi:MAG: hypothetical protein LC687_05415 [Actinobacteria bacterium]|nr:hypothetical protein [Actinomycetota bacterium]MCA1807269.1 hypothetical protein [Actinomycetota bacterium]
MTDQVFDNLTDAENDAWDNGLGEGSYEIYDVDGKYAYREIDADTPDTDEEDTMTDQNAQIENNDEKLEEVKELIETIPDDAKLNMKMIAEKLNEVIEAINTQQPTGPSAKDLKSERSMTEDDARRALLGDLAEMSHKEAAEELGLSYGQIYSARKGFTFKKVYKDYRMAEADQS